MDGSWSVLRLVSLLGVEHRSNPFRDVQSLGVISIGKRRHIRRRTVVNFVHFCVFRTVSLLTTVSVHNATDDLAAWCVRSDAAALRKNGKTDRGSVWLDTLRDVRHIFGTAIAIAVSSVCLFVCPSHSVPRQNGSRYRDMIYTTQCVDAWGLLCLTLWCPSLNPVVGRFGTKKIYARVP